MTIPEITFDLMHRFDAGLPLPVYQEALRRACDRFPPPFGTSEYGDVYREAASARRWMVVSLLTNAEREGDGARRLWSLAACTRDAEVAARVKQHAIDESNHAKMYLKIADIVFEGAVDPEFRTELNAVSPGFSHSMDPVAEDGSPFAHAITLDDLIQMNIAEIRTTIHHLLQRPMLAAHCRPDRLERLEALEERLLGDEVKHVGYTAKLIDQWPPASDVDVFDLYSERLNDFNGVTRRELERRVFEAT